MPEETRITANPTPKDTRITADTPSIVDSRICLLPKDEEGQPGPRVSSGTGTDGFGSSSFLPS
jgi:hypothetical protein